MKKRLFLVLMGVVCFLQGTIADARTQTAKTIGEACNLGAYSLTGASGGGESLCPRGAGPFVGTGAGVNFIWHRKEKTFTLPLTYDFSVYHSFLRSSFFFAADALYRTNINGSFNIFSPGIYKILAGLGVGVATAGDVDLRFPIGLYVFHETNHFGPWVAFVPEIEVSPNFSFKGDFLLGAKYYFKL